MIYALEGISAVGKTSLCEGASAAFSLPVYSDPVRHGLLGDLTRRDLFLTGNQCHVTLSSISRLVDVVSDRWCLSSYVYDCWGDPTLGGVYRQTLLPLYVTAAVRTYLLRVDPELAHRRMLERAQGPTYTLQQLQTLDVAFLEASEVWRSLGGHVLVVDSTDVSWASQVVLSDISTTR